MENHTSTPFHRGQEKNPARSEDGEEPVSLDRIYDLLRNRRARYVLEYLNTVDRAVALDDVAEQIAARENATEPTRVTPGERERVHRQLYQCVLPKMDEFGAISYDESRQEVEDGEYAESFRTFLPEHRFRSRRHGTRPR